LGKSLVNIALTQIKVAGKVDNNTVVTAILHHNDREARLPSGVYAYIVNADVSID
jgi:hypothetical protein